MALHTYFPRPPCEVLELARRRALAGPTGFDSPNEPPPAPGFTGRTVDEPAEQAAARLAAGLA